MLFKVSMKIALKTDMNSPWTNKFSSSQQQTRCDFLVLKFSKHWLLFYQLLYSAWRMVRALGLTKEYNTNEQLKLFVGKLLFLRQADVQQGMLFLRNNIYGKSNLHVLHASLHSFFIC